RSPARSVRALMPSRPRPSEASITQARFHAKPQDGSRTRQVLPQGVAEKGRGVAAAGPSASSRRAARVAPRRHGGDHRHMAASLPTAVVALALFALGFLLWPLVEYAIH